MRPLVAHCHFGLGKMHRRRGDREQAQEHVITALSMYREMAMTYWLKQAEAELHHPGLVMAHDALHNDIRFRHEKRTADLRTGHQSKVILSAMSWSVVYG